MDDKRAAFLLGLLLLGGAGTRFALAPRPAQAPGDVSFVPATDSPPASPREVAHQALRLSRPLQPGERIDLNQATALELTRLPRVGPALAQRLVQWRTAHGPFHSLAALDSVPGVGPKLLEGLRNAITFSGEVPPAP
ncbi:MAG TPA: helix-hairpin-helix domain-containing protein [Gemmatimonadales bacterium]|jgi:competence protein ComEA|nr:helix-hairpin-helix domain-containing protein [Gemmatimonadales bacterium]